ncbi:MAG: hypothetical protein J3K34DRAFT_409184 [Monoraphidium minutum]|nr:MAG: hypothetical protein J3K34DRAFT_409184 [Monoraphidium minutum]
MRLQQRAEGARAASQNVVGARRKTETRPPHGGAHSRACAHARTAQPGMRGSRQKAEGSGRGGGATTVITAVVIIRRGGVGVPKGRASKVCAHAGLRCGVWACHRGSRKLPCSMKGGGGSMPAEERAGAQAAPQGPRRAALACAHRGVCGLMCWGLGAGGRLL